MVKITGVYTRRYTHTHIQPHNYGVPLLTLNFCCIYRDAAQCTIHNRDPATISGRRHIARQLHIATLATRGESHMDGE